MLFLFPLLLFRLPIRLPTRLYIRLTVPTLPRSYSFLHSLFLHLVVISLCSPCSLCSLCSMNIRSRVSEPRLVHSRFRVLSFGFSERGRGFHRWRGLCCGERPSDRVSCLARMRHIVASEWSTERCIHLDSLQHLFAGAAAQVHGIRRSVLQTTAKQCCKVVLLVCAPCLLARKK